MKARFGKKGWLNAAGAAALCLILTLFQMKAYALDGVETGRSCRLTVSVESVTDEYADLKTADITVDLYRVAEITGDGKYTAVSGFESLDLDQMSDAEALEQNARAVSSLLGLPYGKDQGKDAENDTEEEQETLSRNPDYTSEVTGGKGTFSGLKTGLYLVYAREADTEDYAYTFTPYLVSLPNNGLGGTWDYDVTVGLKPEQDTWRGELRIQKTLNTYNASLGDAAFIFQIDAHKDMDGDGTAELVYSDVVSLNFTDAGVKTAVVSDIPMGAVVTVSEVYSGSSYVLTGVSASNGTVNGDTVEVTIVPEGSEGGTATVFFENDYDRNNRQGSSVVNHFEYNGTGWEWSQKTDNQEADREGE